MSVQNAYQQVRTRADAVWQPYANPGRVRIDVTVATCSHAAGVHRTWDALEKEIAARGAAVDLGVISCAGWCWLEPSVIVTRPDGSRVLHGPVRPTDVGPLLDAVTSRAGFYDRLAIAVLSGQADGVATDPAFAGWLRPQVRWLMANVGLTDPENIDHYIARDGFKGLARALDLTQEEIIKEMLDSGVWGRGGAAFPAGRKWDFLRGARNMPKYIVCNADEGDPGAFVNRILLEGDPGIVLEGMAIAAAAAGAEYGYLYIRDEYPLAVERCEKAVAQLEARGLLGRNILGKDGFNFHVTVVRGAGAYVCGEETGLLSSIQDSRGMPRIKPPFPANAGVFGLPTNVNNVETYACAPVVFRHADGAERYKSQGTPKSTGTKMFSITGDVERVAAFEVPFGIPTRTLIEACGGPPDNRLKIIQPGGPLLGMLPGRAIDTALDLDPYREWKLLGMGGGGIVVCDDTTCPVDLVQYFEWFAEDESCGRCTTCHGGTQRYVEILRRIADGGGRMSDLELLVLLKDTMRWANCFHGQGAPAAVDCLLMYFRDELIEHIQEKRCRAGVCRGLIRYEVEPARALDAAPAAAICPTNAIRQDDAGRYVVDQSLCIKCNACHEVQPDVITIVGAGRSLATAAAD
jgi:NADH:ubiquinone oxidoreductase subunit F (NADH-binding)